MSPNPVQMCLSDAEEMLDGELGEAIDIVRSGIAAFKEVEKAITTYKRAAAVEAECEEVLDQQLEDAMESLRSGLASAKALEKSVTRYKRDIRAQQAEAGTLEEQAAKHTEEPAHGAAPELRDQAQIIEGDSVVSTHQNEVSNLRTQAAKHEEQAVYVVASKLHDFQAPAIERQSKALGEPKVLGEAKVLEKPRVMGGSKISGDSTVHRDLGAAKPYSVLLVDADSYILSEEAVKQRDVFELRKVLVERLIDYANEYHLYPYRRANPSGPAEYIVKMYYNQRGLIRALRRYKKLRIGSESYVAILRSLSTGDGHWEVVDVGEDAQAADKSIINDLKRHYDDKACRRIFFAGIHNTGYADHLKQLSADNRALKKISLVTSWTTRPEYMRLRFEILVWDDIFCNNPLHATQSRHPPPWTKSRKEVYEVLWSRARWTAKIAWDGFISGDDGEGSGDDLDEPTVNRNGNLRKGRGRCTAGSDTSELKYTMIGEDKEAAEARLRLFATQEDDLTDGMLTDDEEESPSDG